MQLIHSLSFNSFNIVGVDYPSTLRYQFLEEAFQNQKGIIENGMTKLQDKKNYVHYSVTQVQSR